MPPRKSKDGKAGDGDRHQKKRVGVNFPEDWHAVMRKLAAKQKMPVLWYLIDLAKREAEQIGMETPQTPWDDEEPEPKPGG